MRQLPQQLSSFIKDLTAVIDHATNEGVIREKGILLLARLVSEDDWLPAAYARPDPEHYQQYLLYYDSAERFSVVSSVWGPGQATPIHDHQTWGLIGMLRGSEVSQRFTRDATGLLRPAGSAAFLLPGDVEAVSPEIGDIHQVANASPDEISISIHVYGADIGKVERFAFDESGRPKSFISGYANAAAPNSDAI